MLVKKYHEIPDEIFYPALEEINQINWATVHDVRAAHPAFSTSTSIHLRRHAISNKTRPKNINECHTIVECEDKPDLVGKYLNVRNLADYVYKQVNGISLGRLMIVNLAPRGKVMLHVDPSDYFVMYSRFHVPVKTNELVTFSGGPDTVKEHMPYKTLCQLNNRELHQLDNDSDENRIHVIIDVAVQGGNQIF